MVARVTAANYVGSATNTLVISKAAATVMLASLAQTYTGSALNATATTTRTGLSVNFTYDGSANAPTNAARLIFHGVALLSGEGDIARCQSPSKATITTRNDTMAAGCSGFVPQRGRRRGRAPLHTFWKIEIGKAF